MSDGTDWTPDFGGITRNPPQWAAKRPLRIAILGDFGAGALRGRLDTGAALAKRKPLKVEFDTLDDAIGRLGLKLMLPLGAGGEAVEVAIDELESFHPDELYRNVEVFSALASMRKRLNNASTFAAAAAEVSAFADPDAVSVSRLARQGSARGGSFSKGARLDDFARLTGRPSTQARAEADVDDLLRRVMGPFVVAAPNPKKDALVACVDQALTDAMRAVLHQADFQNTESLWRGVDFLLRRLETSHALQVHLFDISAEEFAADLSASPDLTESGLYKLLVDTPSQEADGGYTYLAGCYHFDATPPHAELLGRAARVAAHAGAPLLTGIATDPFANRREPPHRLIREAFTALKEMSDASFLGLFGPKFLLRHPYGKKSDPITTFAFEEFSRNAGLRGMLWGHPALLALAVLGTPGGQLAINDLPFHHCVDDDGDSIALPCTDRLVSTEVATLLRDVGINGVMAYKGQPLVRLSGLQAVNDDGLAAANAQSRRPAAASRVAIGSREGASETVAAWSAPVRQAGAPQATAAPQVQDQEQEREAEEDAPAESSDSSVDAELDALLAGLDTPAESPAADAAAPEEAAAADGGADDELAALLASLDAPAEPAAEAGGGAAEEAVDPELDALLKSLG